MTKRVTFNVKIQVHQRRSHERYETRAFPTGQGPGLFSAPLRLAGGTHWVCVQVKGDRVKVIGGTRAPGAQFQLQEDHKSAAALEDGAAQIDYEVGDAQIRVQVSERKAKPAGQKRMEQLLASAPAPRKRPSRSENRPSRPSRIADIWGRLAR